jgi:hypothetical protein
MNFQDLYKKIADIDRTTVTESQVDECGAMPSSMPTSSPTQPMSMTVNLNAQGESDISSLMRLLTKVNPDMMPKHDMPMTTVGPELTIGGPGPKMSSPADDIKGDMMKLLPLDKEAVEPEGEEDDDIMNHLNKELKPYDDHVAKLKNKEKEESFQDATTEPDEEYKDVDYMTNKLAGGMNGPKKTYPKVAGGDNPMQKTEESADLLSQIRAELQARLAEAKSK